MLLYLQDEISELEAQLAELDRVIGAEGADAEGAGASPPAKSAPPRASRRQAVNLAGMGSQPEWQRQECLARCFNKLEQYSRALASYARLTRELSPARQEDVARYRRWIEEHAPLDAAECAFLSDDGSVGDLIAVIPPSPSSSSSPDGVGASGAARTLASSSSLHHQNNNDNPGKLDAAPTIFLTFIALVVVFKFVPGVIARLVVAAMLALGAWVAGGGGMGGGRPKPSCKASRTAVLTWMAVVAVLAVVVN